jgi:tetratricopeptide (TPR) repeat protein
LFEASLSSQLETLGEANPDTLVSMGNLAGLYFAQGRFDEAISLYRQTLEGSEITLGLNHPETTLVRLKLKQAMLSNLVEDGEEQ